MIPKKLHFIWVGDESKRPNRCIQSWRDHHPDWTIRVWGNAELQGRNWLNRAHIDAMATREWAGVADLMRWEILFDEGGVVVDADSFCLRPLSPWLLECEAFACWENELLRPGLISNGTFGSLARTPFLATLINDIRMEPTVIDRMAWETVGPMRLTQTWKKAGYSNLTLLPSHFFIPRHFTGAEYTGGGPVYAQQEWGSTLRKYEQLADGGTAPTPASAEPPPGQAFLHEPDWTGSEWVEVLLAYTAAFTPRDPVALVLVLDPAAPGQMPLAQAEEAVLQLLAKAGKAHFPELILVDDLAELPAFLRKYPQATWVPKGKGNAKGFRGALGEKFAKARRQLAAQ